MTFSSNKFIAVTTVVITAICVLSWFSLDFAWFASYNADTQFINAMIVDTQHNKPQQFDVIPFEMLNEQLHTMNIGQLAFIAALCCIFIGCCNLFALYIRKHFSALKSLKVLTAKQLIVACVVFLLCYIAICQLINFVFSFTWLWCCISLAVTIELIMLSRYNRCNK